MKNIFDWQLEFLERNITISKKIGQIGIIIGLFFADQIATSIAVVGNFLPNKGNVFLFSTIFMVFGISMYFLVAFVAYKILQLNAISPIFEKFKWQNIKIVLYSFLAMLIASVVVGAITTIFGLENTQNQASIEQLMTSVNPSMIGLIILAVFGAPILEELIFRGLLMNTFATKVPVLWQLFFSAFWFAFIHVFEGSLQSLFSLEGLLSLLIYITIGFFLAYVYRRTGKIQYSMLLHFIWNAMAMILLLITPH